MTPHFTNAELACKCGCGMLPQQDFMDKIEKLRVSLGFALPVNSAARCPEYNAKVSSTGLTGPHTTGRAIDLGVRGLQAYQLLACAVATGFDVRFFTGIGVAQKGDGRFIHLDDLLNSPTSPRPFIWSY